MRQIQRTFLIVGLVLIAFFLLKRPAYYGDVEPFMMDGGVLVKYVGYGIGGLLLLAGIMYAAIRWMESSTPKPMYDNHGRLLTA